MNRSISRLWRQNGRCTAHPPRRTLPGRHIRDAAYACALALLLALNGAGFSTAALASQANGQIQLSTPVVLTSLAVSGFSTTLLDSHGRFHILTTNKVAHDQIDLDYTVVASDGQSVQVVRKPVKLAAAADSIESAALALDSHSRLQAAWIEFRNGIISIRYAVLEDPTAPGGTGTITPRTLYQSTNSLQHISGGADGNGNTFYTWLDSTSGTPNLMLIQIHNNQSAGTPIQLTHQTDGLAFPHLAVYPNGSLAVVLMQQSPKGGWDLNIEVFDSAGTRLHDPTTLAQQLHPGPLNTVGRDTNDFRFDPLAVSLDARQHLHIAWGAILQLGYADVTLQPDHSFRFHPTTLNATTYDYQQLCMSTGPATPPSQTAPGTPAPVWLAWIDDSHGSPMHPYIAQINDQGTFNSAPVPLVDQITIASNPCIQQDRHGGLYVTWQQYTENDAYVLKMATNTIPPQIPFWVKLGLNRDQPIQQLIFIVLGSILLGALALLPNLLAIPVAAVVIKFGTHLHIPRLILLLPGLATFVAIDVWFQGFMAANFQIPTPPFIWSIIGSIAALAVLLYMWFRSRRFPPETLGAIGQLILASYIGAIIISMPLIYIFTQHQS